MPIPPAHDRSWQHPPPVDNFFADRVSSDVEDSPSVDKALPTSLPTSAPEERHARESKFRGRLTSRESVRSSKGSSNYFDRILRALHQYEVLAAADGSRFVELDPHSLPRNMKKERRTFILRNKNAAKHRQGPEEALGFGPPLSSASDRYDYKQKYPEDKPSQAFAPNARVWRVYNDEAAFFDIDMVDSIRDTVDAILVFAGLFSAIVSTLVSQASIALQLDYVQVTAALMMELIAVQRAMAAGTPVDQVRVSPISTNSPPSATSSITDRWVNGLWFTSLAFSLATALIAVLVKQWIQAYTSPSFQGSARDHGRIRHFRYMGLEKWHVPLIVGLLPTLLHLSLLLFFIGLVIHVQGLDTIIAWVVAGITVIAYLAYFAANVLPVWEPQCPYKTPISQFAYTLRSSILAPLAQNLIRYMRSFPFSSFLHRSRNNQLSPPPSDITQNHPVPTPRTLKEMEFCAVQAMAATLDVHMLDWLHQTSSSPPVQSIIHHAVGELPEDTPLSPRVILRQNILGSICDELKSLHTSWIAAGQPSFCSNRGSEQRLRDLMSAHLFVAPGAGLEVLQTEGAGLHSHSTCQEYVHDILSKDEHWADDSQYALFLHLYPHPHPPGRTPLLRPSAVLQLRETALSMNLWISLLQRQLITAHQNPQPPAQQLLTVEQDSILQLCDSSITSLRGPTQDFFTNVEKVLIAAYLGYWADPHSSRSRPPMDPVGLDVALFKAAAPTSWPSPAVIGSIDTIVHAHMTQFSACLLLDAAATPADRLPALENLVPMKIVFRYVQWGAPMIDAWLSNAASEQKTLFLQTAHLVDRLQLENEATTHNDSLSQTLKNDSNDFLILYLAFLQSLMGQWCSPTLCDAFREHRALHFLRVAHHHLTISSLSFNDDSQAHHSRAVISTVNRLIVNIIAGYIRELVRARSEHNAQHWQERHFRYMFSELRFISNMFMASSHPEWDREPVSPNVTRVYADDLIGILAQQPHDFEWNAAIAELRSARAVDRYALTFLDKLEKRLAELRKQHEGIISDHPMIPPDDIATVVPTGDAADSALGYSMTIWFNSFLNRVLFAVPGFSQRGAEVGSRSGQATGTDTNGSDLEMQSRRES